MSATFVALAVTEWMVVVGGGWLNGGALVDEAHMSARWPVAVVLLLLLPCCVRMVCVWVVDVLFCRMSSRCAIYAVLCLCECAGVKDAASAAQIRNRAVGLIDGDVLRG